MAVNLMYFTIYICVVNFLSYLFCLVDKKRAKSGGERISENNLWLFACIGGSPVMYITMKTIRHKTRHAKFMIGIPIIFICQVILCVIAVKFLGVRFYL